MALQIRLFKILAQLQLSSSLLQLPQHLGATKNNEDLKSSLPSLTFDEMVAVSSCSARVDHSGDANFATDVFLHGAFVVPVSCSP